MASATYSVEFPGVGCQSLLDGLFSILNASSNYLLEIRRIECRFAGAYAANQISKVRLSRITATGGGQTLTPVSLDVNNATLPSQVMVSAYNSDLVATESDVFRTLVDIAAIAGKANQTNGFGSPLQARFVNAGRTSTFSWGSDIGGNALPIVMNEAEGIGIFTTQPGIPHMMKVSALLRVVATGATFQVCETLIPLTSPNTGMPTFTVFNGSGSGVVLQLMRLDITTVGGTTPDTSTTTLPSPAMRLGFIDSYVIAPKLTSFTPVPFAIGQSMPTGFTFGSLFLALAMGARYGAQISWPYTNTQTVGTQVSIFAQQSPGRVRQHSHASFYSNDGTAGLYPGSEAIYDAGDGQGIILRPGAGFAAMSDLGDESTIDYNAVAIYDFRVMFTIRAINANYATSGATYVS